MTHAAEDLAMLDADDGSESARVRGRRYDEARDAGLSPVEAELFADSGTDIGLLRLMVAGHASADVIARTLL